MLMGLKPRTGPRTHSWVIVELSAKTCFVQREKEINSQARPVPAKDSLLPPSPYQHWDSSGAQCLGLFPQPGLVSPASTPWGRRPRLVVLPLAYAAPAVLATFFTSMEENCL